MIEVSQGPATPWTGHYSNIYSQYGEDGLLAEIFRIVGTTNKQCFECGAADGKWFSNSRRLIDAGWSAALIESDPKNWPELDKLDAPPRINVVHGRAEPAGVDCLDSIMAQCGFDTSMDLGVIDVDGQDYYLWNGMLKYRPRVMVVEYDRFVATSFVPDLNGPGQAGLSAICSIAVSKGYFSAATTPTNMIFIRNDLREKFMERAMVASKPEPQKPTHDIRVIENGKAVGGYYGVPDSAKTLVERISPRPDSPSIATGEEQEIKIAAILSRPRFGLNSFWDCASEALAPWHIPIQSFYGVFWGMCLERAMEDNIAAGVDWILTLDYDSMFTSRHVQQLVDALGQNPTIDAVAALQCRRGRPLPLAVRADGSMPMTGAPVPVRTAHFGLTLLRVSAIKRMMKKPWFWSKPAADGSWGEGRLDDDIYFWGNWGDSGNSLYVHTGCRIGHTEEMVSSYDEKGVVSHAYISQWKKDNGFQIRSFE